MAHRLERLIVWRSPRAAVLLAGAAAVVVVGMLLSRPVHRPDGDLQSLVVRPRPFTATLDVVGVIKADQPVGVVAPFDGAVTDVDFLYGDPIAAGQILVRMDDGDIAQRAREARTTLLKAQAAAGDMAAWASSPEVSRARRARQSAELELADTRRKLDESQGLLRRGLIPRSEYDGLAQQLRAQEINAASANEDLAAATKRGQGPNREIANLDLQSSHARLRDLQSQMQGSILRAPVTGVMIRPPASPAGEAEIHVGQRLSRGQLIGSIARRDALVVEFVLNEVDAGRVRAGQAAVVSGGGLGARRLKGTVLSVAGEAQPSATASGSSTVVARVRLADSPRGADSVRIGSTASVSISIRETQSAIVLPPQAVQGGPPSGQVLVRNPQTHQVSIRPVAIGEAGVDGIEILSGLKAGEAVVWLDAHALNRP